MQHLESAEFTSLGILRVTAELQEFILRLLSIEEKYKSPYVVYLHQGKTNFDDTLLYLDAATKFAVDKALS